MRRRNSLKNPSGFTLMEIMIVLAIIAAVVALGAPRLMDKKSKMKSAIRKLGTLTKEIHNSARLKNSTFRLVLNLPEEPNKAPSYWLESKAGSVLLMTEEQEKEQARLTRIQREGEQKEKNQGFSTDVSLMKEPQKLPDGLFFDDVEFGTRNSAITSGTAFIHFFPSGLVEEVAIHMSDKKTLHWTIAIHPLTGRIDIFEKNVPLKEIRAQ